MNIPDEVIRVYDTAYDDTLPIVQAEHAAIQAVALWARKEALKEAAEAVYGLRFPQTTYLDALSTIGALAEGDQS